MRFFFFPAKQVVEFVIPLFSYFVYFIEYLRINFSFIFLILRSHTYLNSISLTFGTLVERFFSKDEKYKIGWCRRASVGTILSLCHFHLSIASWTIEDAWVWLYRRRLMINYWRCEAYCHIFSRNIWWICHNNRSRH